MPFSTHGKALSGTINILKRAMHVNTLAEVNWLPRSKYVVKLRMEIETVVVAHKYTHTASRYFNHRSFPSSLSRPKAISEQDKFIS